MHNLTVSLTNVSSLADLLLTQETPFIAAGLIIPFFVQVGISWKVKNKGQTLFTAYGGFPTGPKCDVPRGTVNPLPDGLFFNASEPDPVMSALCHLLQDAVFETVIDHGCQVTSLLLAEVLCSSPALVVVAGTQVVAVAVVLFPTIFAGADALVFGAV